MAGKWAKIRFKGILLQVNFKYGPANITRSDQKKIPMNGGGKGKMLYYTEAPTAALSDYGFVNSTREPLPTNISTTGTSLY